jgi:hypothetical protein
MGKEKVWAGSAAPAAGKEVEMGISRHTRDGRKQLFLVQNIVLLFEEVSGIG